MRLNYAIVFVGDMSRSVRFYRDVVGLPLKFETPGWTEFGTEGATLALHASEATATGQDDPGRVPPGRCRPGIQVPDLAAFAARMKQHGVICLEEPREAFGARLAQYLDPDGLGFSVSEAPKHG